MALFRVEKLYGTNPVRLRLILVRKGSVEARKCRMLVLAKTFFEMPIERPSCKTAQLAGLITCYLLIFV